MKNVKNIDKKLEIQESWSINKLTQSNKEYLLRFNKWLWNVVSHPSFPYQIGIAISLQEETQNGFPTNKENSKLNEVEDDILKIFGVNKKSIFAGAITGNNMKEFVLYASDPDEIKEKYEAIKNKNGTYSPQLVIQEDKNWAIFKAYCPE